MIQTYIELVPIAKIGKIKSLVIAEIMGGRHVLRQWRLVAQKPPPLSRGIIVPPNFRLERTVAQVVTSLSQVKNGQ